MKNCVPIARYWWFLLLGALLGICLASLLFAFAPRQYASSAELVILFDFTSYLGWSDRTMLQLTEQSGALLLAPRLIHEVAAKAGEQGITISADQLAASMRAEQQFYGWVMTLQADDPQSARQLTRLWVQQASHLIEQEVAALQQYAFHQQQSQALLQCLQWMASEPPHPLCNFEQQERLQTLLVEQNRLLNEKNQSLQFFEGFSPHFEIVFTHDASQARLQTPSLRPVFQVLFALGGLLLSVVLLHWGLPQNILEVKDNSER